MSTHRSSRPRRGPVRYVVIQRGPRPGVTQRENGHNSEETSTSKNESYAENGVNDAEDTRDVMMEQRLSLDAYGWPRLVFPPLKRSGHIILDGCTKEGMFSEHNIVRLRVHDGRSAYL